MGQGFLVLSCVCGILAGCSTTSIDHSAIGPFVRSVQPLGPDLRVTRCEIVFEHKETTNWFLFFFSSNGNDTEVEEDLSEQDCRERMVGERWLP